MPTSLRSALFMPASNARALEKAAGLAADALIFDLEDAVAPDAKENARLLLKAAQSVHDYSKHFSVVRINALNTEWGEDDARFVGELRVDAILLPKVESVEQVEALTKKLIYPLPVWCNIETPLGVLKAPEIAAHPRVTALVAGTNDLARDLRLRRTPDRHELQLALQTILLAARAYEKVALDGTFINLKDTDGFARECEQGRTLGFDGKTLIHPSQIDLCNRAFSPSANEIAHAQAVVAAYEQAMKEGKAVTTVDGSMIEKLHYDDALALLATSSLRS